MRTSDPKPLILVPTAFELSILKRCEPCQALTGYPVELCGFGLVASAARAAALIERCSPSRVMLLGIAGSYDEAEIEIGKAYAFDQVICDGIGVGEGPKYCSAKEMGWNQWQDKSGDTIIEDSISSTSVPTHSLLTVAAASSDFEHAKQRMQRHPQAMAEDMEGFSVATACRLAEIPWTIVRGISNRAGDRDTSVWQTELALQACLELALIKLNGE